MSFSLDVKTELSKIPLGKKEERWAELYSILGFSKYFTDKKHIFASEVKPLVERLSLCLYDTLEKTVKTYNNKLYCLSCNIDLYDIMIKLKEMVNSSDNTLTPHILRGAFLSCGNITNPVSNYHLEFFLKNLECFDLLINLFNKVKVMNINPKIIKRRHSEIYVYIKDNSQIIDFLTYIGATNASMYFIQVKMMKETRNYVNRTTNFETANITKTTNASLEQINKIKKIINSKGLDYLPQHLKETAVLRIKHPYLSLEELSKLFSKSITKSGVNYRLKRLMEYLE